MNKRFIPLLFIILITVIFIGCTSSIDYLEVTNNNKDIIVNPNPDILRKNITLYFGEYLPSKNSSLFEEERTIEYSPNHLEEAVMDALKSGPKKNVSFRNIITPHLQILGVNVIKDTAFVNFSSKNLYGGKKEESLLIASVVKTLTSIEKIEKVYFLVDGKKTESLMGHISARNYFSANSVDILLKDHQSKHPLTLWFPKKEKNLYSEPSKEIRLIDHPPTAKTIIGNLLLGPTTPTSKGCIPSNIEISNVTTKNSTAYVNFSNKNLYTYKGNYEIEYNMQHCIVKSLLNLENIDKVVFLVDGNKGFRLVEKIPIHKPFTETDLVLDSESTKINEDGKHKINIYHPLSLETPLKFNRWERSLDKAPVAEDVIAGLLIKPSNEEVYKDFTLPYITNILQDGHIVYINFASGDIEINKDLYASMETAIISSIVRSLCDLPEVKEVMFFVDGKPKDFFIYNVDISIPFTMDSLERMLTPDYEPEIFDLSK